MVPPDFLISESWKYKVPSLLDTAETKLYVEAFFLFFCVQRKWHCNMLIKGFHLCVRLIAGGSICDIKGGSKIVQALRTTPTKVP